MKTVGSYEAKTHFTQLLKDVSQGKQFVITKHGVPIALLQPIILQPKKDIKTVIKELKKFRSEHQLTDLAIREMKVEGRR